MATPIAIVAYLGLFAGVAVLFLFVNLLVGRLLRPRLPNREKLEVYECGEPTIGSSFVQFDLRFYVVALLFIIFDVEVAFFFPWATVFGKSTQLSAPDMPVVMADLDPEGGAADQLAPQATARLRELGVREPSAETIGTLTASELRSAEAGVSTSPMKATVQTTARRMALASLWDIGVFFAVLMVGFAYVWKRGDLDWVRSVRSHAGEVVERAPVTLELEQKRGRATGSILSA